jgi:hypothetical protein
MHDRVATRVMGDCEGVHAVLTLRRRAPTRRHGHEAWPDDVREA